MLVFAVSPTSWRSPVRFRSESLLIHDVVEPVDTRRSERRAIKALEFDSPLRDSLIAGQLVLS